MEISRALGIENVFDLFKGNEIRVHIRNGNEAIGKILNYDKHFLYLKSSKKNIAVKIKYIDFITGKNE